MVVQEHTANLPACKNYFACFCAWGHTVSSLVRPESLQSDAEGWTEPRLLKIQTFRHCSNQPRSCAPENPYGVPFLATCPPAHSFVIGKLQTDAASGKIEHLCCATSQPENLTVKLWSLSSRACPPD